MAASGSCAYALPFFVFESVKPLANVISDYTCSDRENKGNNILHDKITSFLVKKRSGKAITNYITSRVFLSNKAINNTSPPVQNDPSRPQQSTIFQRGKDLKARF